MSGEHVITFECSSDREVITSWCDEYEVTPGVTITLTTDAAPNSIARAFRAIDQTVDDLKAQLAQLAGLASGPVIVAGPEAQDTRRKP